MASSTDTSNAAAIQAAQQAGGLTATSQGSVPVTDISQIPAGAAMYWSGGGQTPNVSGYGMHGTAGQGTHTTPMVNKTVTDWLNYFYTQIANSAQAMQQFSTEAQLAGLVGANANTTQLYAAWQKLVVQAYNHNINKQAVTPWDVLANSIPGTEQGTYQENAGQVAMQSMTSQQAADIATKAAQKDAAKNTQTSEIDINYTDPDTARYVLNQASQQLLGRQATNAEVAAFTKTLNNDEAMFPKMTQDTKSTQTGTSTTTTPGTQASISEVGSQGQTVVGYDAAGNPIYGPTGTTTTTGTNANTTDTVVSLGEQDYTRYGRQQLAEDAAKSAPDYGAYQAAGPLFQAFLGTLKGAVSNVGSNA